MAKSAPHTFPKREHDHARCIATALKLARAKCAAQGIKWTALREKIFVAISASHEPIGAYELIEKLAGQGKRLAPVSIYRILDVLQKGGLIHKIESRNAYFVCLTQHETFRQPLIFLCEDCGRVTEADVPDAMAAILASTEAGHFTVRNAVLELSGVCEECSTGARKYAPC